eukprot:scaffold221158_cov36-Prasinocladus_malaysianus.AAC.1
MDNVCMSSDTMIPFTLLPDDDCTYTTPRARYASIVEELATFDHYYRADRRLAACVAATELIAAAVDDMMMPSLLYT